MTISTSGAFIIVSTNQSVGPFSFPFVGAASSDIYVTSIASSGLWTPLLSSQYNVSLNSPNPNQLWGVGGTVTLTSTPSSGTDLLIQRLLPLTQNITTQNQGNYSGQVTEQALDVLEMQIQQVSNRTGQFRGIWAANTVYSYGDVVQDGVNGLDSLNYYMNVQTYTSTTSWFTDLANGYWTLVIQSTIPVTPLPLSIANGGTGASTSGAALANLGGIGLSANNVFTGTNSFVAGAIEVPTAALGDSSSNAASTDFVATAIAQPQNISSFTVTATNTTTSRTLANQLGDVLDVKDFGAVGNGINDDTSAINTAISTAATAGGYVYLPSGTYKTTASISFLASNVKMIGAGRGASIIAPNFATTDVIAIGSTGLDVGNFTLQGFSVNPSVSRSGGANINIAGAKQVLLDDFDMTGGYNGINVDNYGNQSGLTIRRGEILSCSNYTMVMGANSTAGQPVNEVFITDLTGSLNTNGINLVYASGLYVKSVSMYKTPNPIFTFAPTSTTTLNDIYFEQVVADSGSSDGFYFGGSSGGEISDIHLIACQASSNSGNGLSTNAGSTLNGLQIAHGSYHINGQNGMVFNNGLNISVIGSNIFNNSTSASNTYNGIGVGSGISCFQIISNLSGLGGTAQLAGSTNYQKWGIQVVSGTSNNYIITGNRCPSNQTGSVSDGGSGTNKYTVGNILG